MTFKEYLLSKGLSEEQAESIVNGMPENEFYLASEEKLDERYSKLKQQKEQLDEQLQTNQTELDALKESAKGNEDLTKQLTDLQEKFNESEQASKTALAEKDKDFAIKLALKEANALDEGILLNLIDRDTVKVTDNGLQGLTEQLDSLKENKAFLFQAETKPDPTPKIVTGGNPAGPAQKTEEPTSILEAMQQQANITK